MTGLAKQVYDDVRRMAAERVSHGEEVTVAWLYRTVIDTRHAIDGANQDWHLKLTDGDVEDIMRNLTGGEYASQSTDGH